MLPSLPAPPRPSRLSDTNADRQDASPQVGGIETREADPPSKTEPEKIDPDRAADYAMWNRDSTNLRRASEATQEVGVRHAIAPFAHDGHCGRRSEARGRVRKPVQQKKRFEEAVEEQEDLLAEFAKVADELKKLFGDLGGKHVCETAQSRLAATDGSG